MHKIGILVAAVLFVILSLYMVSRGTNDHDSHNRGHGNHSAHVAMITSERAFLEHMIPHHQEAVSSAELILQKGTALRPLAELAQDIISGQTTEIEQMKGWYQTWYGVPYEDVGVYAPMMRPLEELSGSESDRAFLEDMILHHEAAVATAQAVRKLSISTETERLTSNIIATQEVEINVMRELIGLLPK
jgi:uncharacterized protein (DUF305 family)